ncbi:myosin-binding protein 2 [Gastrolobium bilobum]|uniref:myosin-binding protein 2 n=1 Tax=Gastrolobium bilobum TaxID=150636 RepID=UPI002AB2087D|nr:myosin-binding protein 2 [Gastrolobium bilobum]XP_061373807.1 myosin-binding protein 2 [Gastrolobium bilobum]
MAANKFATMLHRNTNKITLVLVYAILEWILIILLLLNSLFSYLIIKFADYFGLKRPCMWCTRIDHILEPGKNKNSCIDLVCETHAFEISRLGFCSNHHKLAESKDMCEDCSSSSQPDYVKLSQSFGFFPWMKQIGMIQDSDDKAIEKVEEALKCSCCGVNLDSRFYPPCILIKPSLNVLDYGLKQNLITEGGVDADIDEGDHSDHSRSDFVLDHHEDEQSTEENRGSHIVFEVEQGLGRREDEGEESCACSVCDGGKEALAEEIYKLDLGVEKGKETFEEETLNVPKPKDDDDQPCQQTTAQVDFIGEITEEIPPKHLEFFIHGDDCRLIPVELVDSTATENGNQNRYKVEGEGLTDNEDFILDFDMSTDAEAEPVIENWHISGDIVTEFSCQENKNVFKINGVDSIQLRTRGQSSGLQVEEEKLELNYQHVRFAQTAEDLPRDDNVEANMERRDGELCSDVSLASEDASQMQGEEFEAEVSIGTEIPDHDQVDEYQSQYILLDTNQRIQEDPSTSTVRFHVQDDRGLDNGEEFVEFKTMSLEVRMPTANNHLSSSSLELNENEEEKVPDTPTSAESLHQLHKKLLLLERKESGTEESLDGSVISDIEYGELTIEKLKSALKSERKALSTVYAELEEERSASAVAANHTMAMINRLQEEKAAMQMEALQYQRMMDEQSEYDQEALQILNELMLKREKEKLELEKELEICRKRVHEYEVREKMMMSRRDGSMRSRTSSPSCSNAEDSDGLSIDLNHEAKEENGFYGHQECSNQNTPVDAVLYLEESLANFEEERLSILEQLKVLEEKLVMLNYEEEHCFDDTKSIEHLCEQNGNGYHDHNDYHANGFANGHAKEINGIHHQGGKITGTKPKRLLPLFDAISTEAEYVELSGDENELEFSPLQNSSAEKVNLDKKKLALEEELDHVYERLQVLEADREFLKHCISSLRKGDKGLDLLQEILQHLRDLRNVEFRVRNMGDLAV